MHSSTLLLLLLEGFLSCLLASAMAVGGVPLHSRAVQSMAVCTPQFAWMDNSKKMSPCQLAASVNALCNSGNWILPALNPSLKYDPPTTQDGTATLCTCSWASYNLVSACTACQGFPEQIPQWSFYSIGCGGFLSDVAFPSNITLPESVSIPYWAGEDPNKWPGEKFNVYSAEHIVSEGHADLMNSSLITTIPKTANNTGVIIAGILVGILVIALALTSYMIYRRRKAHQPQHQPQDFPQAFPNLKVMRFSAARPITSPYRTFFAPPSYTESTTHLNASVYRTETQSSIGINYSRTTNSHPGHELAETWVFNNPGLLIAMPQAAAQGWNDKKSGAVNHKKPQLRLVS